MFIARISRGRTIREFVAGVLLVPTLIGSLWFTIFGDSAILRQRDEGGLLVDGAVDTNTSMFRLLETLPLGIITSVLAVFVIVFFFVTSSDSGSLVIDILSSGGDLEPPKATRVYWSVLEGVAAAVLLIIGGAGSLTALQTASIATALPFSIVMLLACVAMLRAFRYDVATTPRLMHISAPDGVPEATADHRPRRDVSATLAGLVAVRSVDVDTFEVHPETGAITVAAPEDPLGGEVFDTEEYRLSAEAERNA
jgi:choline/glycine/proline betaine transport protein